MNKWKKSNGDWGLGIGDWGLGPIPNPQSPIPNPHIFNIKILITILNKIISKNFIYILIKITDFIKSIKIKMASIPLSFDFLGIEQKLNIFEKSRHQTLFGLSISILSCLSIIGFCAYFIKEMLSRQTMYLLSNPSISSKPVLDFNEYPFLLGLFDTKTQLIPSEGLYTITAFFVNNSLQKNSDNKYQPVQNLFEMELEECTNKSLGKYAYLFTNYNLTGLYCIPMNKYNRTLFGAFGSIEQSLIGFYINYCSNLTSNNTCYDFETMQIKLANIYFIFGTIDYQLNHSDPYNTIIPYIKTNSFSLTSLIYNFYIGFYKLTQYETDYGFLLKDLQTSNIIQFDHYNLQSYPPSIGAASVSKNSFGEYILTCNSYQDNYMRSYLKAPAIVANIGGIFQIIIMFGNIFVEFFTKNIFYYDVINNIKGGFNLVDFNNIEIGNNNNYNFNNNKINDSSKINIIKKNIEFSSLNINPHSMNVFAK